MLATRAVLIAASIALAAGPALAQNTRFMRDAPVSFMNREDTAMMVKNYEEALDSLPDGHTNAWLNPRTGHSGTATPLKTIKQNGATCRVIEITNQAGGQSASSEWTFCRTKQGWRTSGR